MKRKNTTQVIPWKLSGVLFFVLLVSLLIYKWSAWNKQRKQDRTKQKTPRSFLLLFGSILASLHSIEIEPNKREKRGVVKKDKRRREWREEGKWSARFSLHSTSFFCSFSSLCCVPFYLKQNQKACVRFSPLTSLVFHLNKRNTEQSPRYDVDS